MQKFGIDVSRWQGDFDFNRAKSEGIEYAIIKCGGADAGLYQDGKFARNYEMCKSLGIPIGTYFFGHEMNLAEAETNAKYCLNLINGKQFEYPIYYDVEGAMLNLDKTLLNQIIQKFCSVIQSAGYFVGIYTSASPFKTKITDTRFTHWVASYGKSKPTGIAYTDIWQFGGGSVNYIRDTKVAGQPCDQDYCYRDFPSEIKAKGLNGFAPSPQPKPSNYLMTAKQYVDTLLHIVNECPTLYSNKYPRNLGYWDGSCFSFDCWNLIKAVLNGWQDNRTVGYYQKDLSKTGDIDGLHILQKCSTRGKDFKKLSIPGTYLFMENDHAGTYVGEYTINGHIVNVIECTSAWTKNVQWSYVDADGYRYQYKGGTKSSRKWDDWGLMDWVDYSDTPAPQPIPVVVPQAAKPKVTENPSGTEAINLQQDLNYLGYTDNKGNSLTVDGVIGNCSKQAIMKLQSANGLTPTGIYDADSYIVMKNLLK